MIRFFWWWHGLMSKMEGGEDMVAMFLAQRIILGKLTFAEVPSSLKPAVKDILVESGP